MVQAKTSDFQPLPLKILNVLSLLAGASLLVAVSWEILLGDPRHYSTDYLLLQGVVCVIFLADFFVRIIRKSKCSTDFKRNDFLKKNEAYPLGALRSLKFAYRKLRISLFVELAV